MTRVVHAQINGEFIARWHGIAVSLLHFAAAVFRRPAFGITGRSTGCGSRNNWSPESEQLCEAREGAGGSDKAGWIYGFTVI